MLAPDSTPAFARGGVAQARTGAGDRRIETASWSSHSFAQRLREVPGVHHHHISGKVFELVETHINYAHRSA